MRLEVEKLFQEVQNLKQLLKDKRIYTEEELKEMLQQNEDKYENTIEKSVIRLMLFGDGKNKINDDWLKPWCFDKWRKFLKEKKVMHFHLDNCNTILGGDPNMSGLHTAFLKWRYKTRMIMINLEKLTTEELMDRTIKNQKILNEQANEMEHLQNIMHDLRHQREYLIEKAVLAQRLALSRLNWSHVYAKLKVWTKMEANGAAGMRAYFDDELGKTLALIAFYKKRMIELEEQNNDIAE